jgi:hypothetical protein
MIRPEQIPDEVVEAAAKAVAEQLGDDWNDNVHTFCGDDWRLTPDGAKEACRAIARAAIAAALNAWPGAAPKLDGRYLLLPLPQEPRRTLDEMRGVFEEAYKSNRKPRDE